MAFPVLPAFLSLAFLLASPGFAEDPSDEGRDEGLVEAEVAAVGVDRLSGIPVALLRELDGGRFIPISIGVPEVRAIAWALAGVEPPRPMTHDLMASLIATSGFEVERLVVHSLLENTYHARLEGRRSGEGELLLVDSRPSDGMALALRLDVPIFVSEDLLTVVPRFDFFPGEAEDQVLRVLGATVVTAAPAEKEAAGIEAEVPALRVVAVADSESEGLRVDDLILEADGEPLRTPEQLLRILQGKSGEEEIELEVLREGETLQIEMPALPPAPPRRSRGTIAQAGLPG